jgi:hypothetical protein
MEVLEYIKERLFELLQAVEDANNDIPIQEDEYYESDEYYLGAINTLTDILTKFGVNA